jgi:hypothetical protein
MTSDGDSTEKHSKRPGEPDPGLDPRPYESSNPGPDAVQRSADEDRTLASLGEGATGDGVEGAEVADESDETSGTEWAGERSSDQVGVELVDQPAQPNMGTPHTAPAPAASRRDRH